MELAAIGWRMASHSRMMAPVCPCMASISIRTCTSLGSSIASCRATIVRARGPRPGWPWSASPSSGSASWSRSSIAASTRVRRMGASTAGDLCVQHATVSRRASGEHQPRAAASASPEEAEAGSRREQRPTPGCAAEERQHFILSLSQLVTISAHPRPPPRRLFRSASIRSTWLVSEATRRTVRRTAHQRRATPTGGRATDIRAADGGTDGAHRAVGRPLPQTSSLTSTQSASHRFLFSAGGSSSRCEGKVPPAHVIQVKHLVKCLARECERYNLQRLVLLLLGSPGALLVRICHQQTRVCRHAQSLSAHDGWRRPHLLLHVWVWW